LNATYPIVTTTSPVSRDYRAEKEHVPLAAASSTPAVVLVISPSAPEKPSPNEPGLIPQAQNPAVNRGIRGMEISLK